MSILGWRTNICHEHLPAKNHRTMTLPPFNLQSKSSITKQNVCCWCYAALNPPHLFIAYRFPAASIRALRTCKVSHRDKQSRLERVRPRCFFCECICSNRCLSLCSWPGGYCGAELAIWSAPRNPSTRAQPIYVLCYFHPFPRGISSSPPPPPHCF